MQQTESSIITPQAVRGRRHRRGVAARLDEICAELRRLAAAVEAHGEALLDRVAERERREGSMRNQSRRW